MIRPAFLFLFLFSFSTAIAQDKLPPFGKIDKADLKIADCEFDPGAEALVLIDVGDMKVTYVSGDGWISESKYRVRIKILKESGLGRAEIKLKYYSAERAEHISDVSGVSFNLDASGNIEESKLNSNAVFDEVIDKDYSEVSFALPNVRKGTVFEYRYSLYRSKFTGIPSWLFQQTIPVKYSAYNIVLPEYFIFKVLSVKRQQMERIEGETANDGVWFVMRNIPGLVEEPFSAGMQNYIQRVQFELLKIESSYYDKEFRKTWPQIAEELLGEEKFGKALKKNLKGTDELNAKVTVANSLKERVRLVYNYVQRHMNWNDENGIYSIQGIKDAWDKKNGSIVDINFILINLLRENGINAKPLLVSTKDNGVVNGEFPFLGQFNAVMVYVEDGEDVYIMNAADKYNPFNLVPYDVLYTNALVVDKENAQIIYLSTRKKFVNNVFFFCNTEPGEKIGGEVTVNSSGYARNIRMSTYENGRLKETLENNEGMVVKIDSLVVNNTEDELLPLEQKARFSGSIQSSGNYLLLPVTLFSGLPKNSFLKDSRVMDIDFYYPKSYVVSGTYVISDDYVINGLPKNTKILMPDTSIILTRLIQQNENIISFKFSLNYISAGYPAESYPYIKEFFKKMYALLDERIILKKK